MCEKVKIGQIRYKETFKFYKHVTRLRDVLGSLLSSEVSNWKFTCESAED